MYTYISIAKQAFSTAAGLVVLLFFIIPMTGLAQVEPMPLNAPTITVSGQNLPQIAPFAATLVATSSTIWDVLLNFDEDTTVPAVVADGTPFANFTNGSLQVVDDCADSDAKTYCFTYLPPSGIEAAIFWFFRVSGAANNSGGYMATTTYRFIVDTLGPTIEFTNIVSSQLPTIEGYASYPAAEVRITFTNETVSRTYATFASSNVWSLTLTTGDELPPGTYTVVATGIDQNKNPGAPIVTSIEIPDTVAPILLESAPIPTSAITTPTYAFISSEFAALTYNGPCVSPTLTAATGTNIIVLNPLTPDTYTTCSITATDGAGNVSIPLLLTPFTITPPPPPSGPTTKDECKENNWKTFTNPTFKNQGDCVSSVTAKKK